MIGVTIMQEGTSNGVVTDIDGNYTIEIKEVYKRQEFTYSVTPL